MMALRTVYLSSIKTIAIQAGFSRKNKKMTLKNRFWPAFLNLLSLSALLALCASAAQAQPIMLGQFDVQQADLHYRNPQAGVALDAAQTRDLVRRLDTTQLLNQTEILDALHLTGQANQGAGFGLPNPYFPRYRGNDLPLPALRQGLVDGALRSNPEAYAQTQEGYHIAADGTREYYSQKPVAAWYADLTHGGAAAQEVCAVRFEADGKQYRLRTFASVQAAQQAGWVVTHQYHCGACSSLKDLAVYIGLPDLTAPARLCAKRGYGRNANLPEVKACLERSVGFTPACAEAWAYNAMHTAQNCMGTCLQAYGGDSRPQPDWLARAQGAWQVLVKEKFSACPPAVPSPNAALRQRLQNAGCPAANEQTGQLNACLWCDERISGPGFKYQAGRTRRNSGLESEIPRDNDHLFYAANHAAYFH